MISDPLFWMFLYLGTFSLHRHYCEVQGSLLTFRRSSKYRLRWVLID